MPIPAAVPFALQAASTVANLFGASAAARRQRRIGEMQAQDALKRGEQSVFEFRGNVARLLGEQRVAMAGNGVDVTSGSAAMIRSETERFAARDLRQLRLNAQLEARALRSGANAAASGMMQQAIGSTIAQFPTLMTSGIDAWQRMGLGKGSVSTMKTGVRAPKTYMTTGPKRP